MEKIAKGTFQVSMRPLALGQEGSAIAGRSLEKTFSGDLQGSSKGTMISAGAPQTGSAGYVAIEHVHATLDGLSGTFCMQHYGIMDKGTSALTIDIVAGSGTEGLSGIAGRCEIEISQGQHFYTLHYRLAD